MSGGTISGCDIGVWDVGNSVTITGGTIENCSNYGISNFFPAYQRAHNISITGCSIKNCKNDDGTGVGVYLYRYSYDETSITNCEISGCDTGIWSNCSINCSGTTISGTTSDYSVKSEYYGQGDYDYAGCVKIDNSTQFD